MKCKWTNIISKKIYTYTQSEPKLLNDKNDEV